MNKLTLVLTISILLIAFLAFAPVQSYVDSINNALTRQQQVQVDDSLDVEIIAVQADREWLVSETVNPLDFFTDSTLYNPSEIVVQDSNIYVADLGIHQIMRFDLEGQFVNKIGNGAGFGPGEFSQIMDFSVANDKLWVAASNSTSFFSFETNGTYLADISIGSFPYRTAVSDPYLLFYVLNPSEPLVKMNYKSGEQYNYGAYIAKQSDIIGTSGLVEFTSDGRSIYIAQFASMIYYYGKNNELERVIQTPDREAFPESNVDTGDGGKSIIRPPSKTTNVMDTATDSDKLYVNTLYTGSHPFSIVDQYQLDTGKYIGSVKLSHHIRNIDVYENRVYAVKDTSVVTFKIPS